MIESLNADCFCVSLDTQALRRAIEADPATQGLSGLIAERCPHLFAALPVFVSRQHVDAMAKVIRAVEEVAALPAYQDAVLARAPAIARHDPGTAGVFMGYDFHLGADGVRRRTPSACGLAAASFSSNRRPATAARRRTAAKSSRAGSGAKSCKATT